MSSLTIKARGTALHRLPLETGPRNKDTTAPEERKEVQ